MVRDGKLVTPDLTSDILESITRDTVIRMGRELGLEVVERQVDRNEIYLAEEAFCCGSGWEIIPVIEVDRLAVGDGTPGPLTRRIQDSYFALVRGEVKGNQPDHREWRRSVWD
jgi:branched-chain amino acid aminotransferase